MYFVALRLLITAVVADRVPTALRPFRNYRLVGDDALNKEYDYEELEG